MAEIMKSPLRTKPLRNPGQSLDEEINRLVNDRVMEYLLIPLILLLVAGMEWIAVWTHLPRQPWLFTALAFIALVAWLAYFRRAWVRLQALKQGREGERFVGQELEQLRETGARIIHDVPAGGFNVDHVVICDKGIFAVETKTWSKGRKDARISVRQGRVLKDGYPTDRNPIEQAEAIGSWLRRTLRESTGKELPVRPVVLFPGWYVEPLEPAMKERLWVLEPKAFLKWIGYEPIRLPSEDVALAAFHLSRIVHAAQGD